VIFDIVLLHGQMQTIPFDIISGARKTNLNFSALSENLEKPNKRAGFREGVVWLDSGECVAMNSRKLCLSKISKCLSGRELFPLRSSWGMFVGRISRRGLTNGATGRAGSVPLENLDLCEKMGIMGIMLFYRSLR
jgi:hypothetical protein